MSTVLAWLELNAAGQKLLPFVLYSVGVIALFYVFRRNLRWRRQHTDEDAMLFRTRSYEAHRMIESIGQQEWLRSYRAAMLVRRDYGALEPAQAEFLRAVTAHQCSRRAH